jgi:hypothetical protein
MAMRKNFVTRKKSEYVNLIDSLSDTEVEFRKNGGEGDMVKVEMLQQSNKKFETGDELNLLFAKMKVIKPLAKHSKAFEIPIRVKDEMKIDLRQSISSTSSRRSSIYKLYPIEEVTEDSSNSCFSLRISEHKRVQKILEDNRAKAVNRPGSARRKMRLNKDFEIRKPFVPSEKSTMDSELCENMDAIAVAKTITKSQFTNTEEVTESDSISSYKRAQINRLSSESMQIYQQRLIKQSQRYSSSCNTQQQSLYTIDDDMRSVCTISSANCLPCCYMLKPFRLSKKNK